VLRQNGLAHRRNPEMRTTSSKDVQGWGGQEGLGVDGKIKRIVDPLSLRSQRAVCTLVFAPCDAVWIAMRNVRGWLQQKFPCSISIV